MLLVVGCGDAGRLSVITLAMNSLSFMVRRICKRCR